jgi:hypothetical protein
VNFYPTKLYGGQIFLHKTFEDLVDKTALIKSLKEPEVTIGDPSPIRGNKSPPI